MCLRKQIHLRWPSFRNFVAHPRTTCPTRGFPNLKFKRNLSDGSWKRWTADEDEKILQLRADGKMPEDMLGHLERSLGAIEGRMYGTLRPKLVERGLLAKFSSPLSKDEIKRIKALRSQSVPWREILQEFPGRSMQAIKSNLRSFDERQLQGRQRNRKEFEDWEDQLLLQYRQDESLHWPDICTRMPNRSPKTIWNRYRKLVHSVDRVFIPRSNLYTPSEVSELIMLRDSGMAWTDIAQHLGKSNTYGARMQYMKEKHFPNAEPKQGRWTKDEDQRLLSLRASRKRGWVDDAVQELGRSPSAVNFRGWHLKTREARRLSEPLQNWPQG